MRVNWLMMVSPLARFCQVHAQPARHAISGKSHAGSGRGGVPPPMVGTSRIPESVEDHKNMDTILVYRCAACLSPGP